MTQPLGFLAILGDAKVGGVLLARPNGITDAAGINMDTQRFEWLRDGVAVAGATSQSYTVTAADRGHNVTVRWSYQDGLGGPKSVTSRPKHVTDPTSEAMTAIYRLVFNRLPDTAGAKFYAGHFHAGIPLSKLVADMERNRAKGAR
ncbi:MAG: hypothetical protein AAF307_10130 [Pseudomonadota bacterium]